MRTSIRRDPHYISDRSGRYLNSSLLCQLVYSYSINLKWVRPHGRGLNESASCLLVICI